MDDPKTVFRNNLRRLAASQGLDFDGLASKLGWRGHAKKWLRRAWRDGLARPDRRSAPLLQYLSTAFGVRDRGFWDPECCPDPNDLLRTHSPAYANGRSLILWSICVRKILLIVKNLPKVWKDNPDDLLAIRLRYKSEQDMIASWLGSNIGNVPLPLDEQEIVRQALDETANQYGGDLSNQLIVYLVKHPRWEEILEKARPHTDKKHLMRFVAMRILDVILRPPTLQEAIARVEYYFGLKPTDPQTHLERILEELSRHPMWKSEYEELISSKWELAKLHVTPEEFVEYCRDKVLD